MRVAIMQPCYLPWHGYFSLMRHCDVFVHLDDAALPMGRTYQTRIGVKTAQGKRWLSVPVKRRKGQTIGEAEVVEDGWRRKHAMTLGQLFASASGEVREELMRGERRLARLNVSLGRIVARQLGLEKEERWASELGVEETGSARIEALCRALGARTYVTGHGSRRYLDHEAMERAGIEVVYVDYCLETYAQPWGDFDPYVSALTLLEHAEEPARFVDCGLVGWREFVKRSEEVQATAGAGAKSEQMH